MTHWMVKRIRIGIISTEGSPRYEPPFLLKTTPTFLATKPTLSYFPQKSQNFPNSLPLGLDSTQPLFISLGPTI